MKVWICTGTSGIWIGSMFSSFEAINETLNTLAEDINAECIYHDELICVFVVTIPAKDISNRDGSPVTEDGKVCYTFNCCQVVE